MGEGEAVALRFAGVARPVVLVDAAEVMAGIDGALTGWGRTAGPASAADMADAVAQITREGAGYRATSAYLDEALTGLPAASAVCAVLADLSEAVFAPWPEAMALHAGGVEIGGRVIAFTGAARAGKSTLMARLTAEGDMRVYCDDVLPVLPGGVALALGMAPRLRIPLPAAASERFRAHVAAWRGISDDKYAYLPAPSVAAHGTRAPMGALVILERRARGPARLQAEDATEAAAHLLLRDMQEAGDAAAHLARVTALAEAVPCLRLVYADLEEAVATIRAAFGAAGGLDGVRPAARRRAGMARRVAVVPVDPGQPLRRDPMAAPRRGRTGLWLVRRGGAGAFHLNPVAGAVWDLLAEPMTGDEIAAALAEVFPGVAPGRIAADVAGLLGGMRAAGLVAPAGG
jgi:hypothetical protein